MNGKVKTLYIYMLKYKWKPKARVLTDNTIASVYCCCVDMVGPKENWEYKHICLEKAGS